MATAHLQWVRKSTAGRQAGRRVDHGLPTSPPSFRAIEAPKNEKSSTATSPPEPPCGRTVVGESEHQNVRGKMSVCESLATSRRDPAAKPAARGGDSHCQTDGDDGDGQGDRFWAEQHRPKGEAPFKRAAGEKTFEP